MREDNKNHEFRRDIFSDLPVRKRDRILLNIGWIIYILPVVLLIILTAGALLNYIYPDFMHYLFDLKRMNDTANSNGHGKTFINLICFTIFFPVSILAFITFASMPLFILPYTVVLILRRGARPAPLSIVRSHRRGVMIFWAAFLLIAIFHQKTIQTFFIVSLLLSG